ncbi:MAG: FkbM family methyltransferase [Stellaceae bacterium]
MNEGLRLLDRVPGLPHWPGGTSSPVEGGPPRADDPVFMQAVAALPQPVHDKIEQIGREAAIMRILRAPAYKNIVRNATEIDATFAMLSDETSIATLEWAIKFRLLMQLYPLPVVNEVLPSPVSAEMWKAGQARVEALSGLPKGLNLTAHVTFWGIGRYSLPGLCSVDPGDVVIEAGAELGESTLYLADLCGPDGHVHAFEFFPDAYARLKDALALNNATNVTPVCEALWDSTGQFPALFSRAGSHLISNQSPNSDNRGQPVQAVSIDDYCTRAGLDRVDFIKIDANGGQKRIVIGARETIARCRPGFAIAIHYGGGAGYYEVPKVLRECLPDDYKFYMRHYSNMHRYTIIYAAPGDSRHTPSDRG